MFEYTFIQVPVTYGRGMSPEPQAAAYENVIHEQARQGWRLVQIFIANPATVPTEYTLIFERPAGNR